MFSSTGRDLVERGSLADDGLLRLDDALELHFELEGRAAQILDLSDDDEVALHRASHGAGVTRVGEHPKARSDAELLALSPAGRAQLVRRSGPDGFQIDVVREGTARGLRVSFAARALVDVARSTAPAVGLIAKTLPETGPSTRILEKAGFARVGHVADDEVGEAWALAPVRSRAGAGRADDDGQ